MIEIWKPIDGTDGKYEVSNTGKVRSLNYYHRKTMMEMKTSLDKYGYRYITLRLGEGKKTTHFTIHRLVAKAFIQNQDGKLEVNHIDGNKQNNNVANLEWVTTVENRRHAWSIGLNERNRTASSERGKSYKTLKRLSYYNDKRKRPIISTCLATGEETRYETQREAARAICGTQGNIQHVLSGKARQHKGYTFRYADTE